MLLSTCGEMSLCWRSKCEMKQSDCVIHNIFTCAIAQADSISVDTRAQVQRCTKSAITVARRYLAECLRKHVTLVHMPATAGDEQAQSPSRDHIRDLVPAHC